MRTYELMFIIKPDLQEENIKENTEQIKSIIEQNGGKITREENWGKKTLAYEIDNYEEGHYIVLNFEGEGKVAKAIGPKLRHNEDIMRWIIVRLDDEMKKPNKMEKKKAQASEESVEI